MGDAKALKIIVLDDDPTGSQTVHGCLLLTRWDVETLETGLQDSSPLLFILMNTRAMSETGAKATTLEVCTNLETAIRRLEGSNHQIEPIIISRSDSTLRGHYPAETDAIASIFGPFDAHFVIPAFIQGGRITRDSTHLVDTGNEYVPVHLTEFARDPVFGYKHSYLPSYVEEKTQGVIKENAVVRITLADVAHITASHQLDSLERNVCCVVDAVRQSDLELFAEAAREATGRGKRFLFRSAAGLVAAMARLGPQPLAPEGMSSLVVANTPGVVIAGSHVPKTTSQIEHLLREPWVNAVPVDVERIATDRERLLRETLRGIQGTIDRDLTAVVYTSRVEKRLYDKNRQLSFGATIAAFLVDVARGLPKEISYIVAKGGITSHELISAALELGAARLKGQIAPGCSVIVCPPEHSRFPGLPVVIFPGNVGGEETLTQVCSTLSGMT